MKKKNKKKGLQVLTTLSSRKSGQGLTEYLILVGLIAIGSMVLVTKFSNSLRYATANIINDFSGQSGPAYKESRIEESEAIRKDLWDVFHKNRQRR